MRQNLEKNINLWVKQKNIIQKPIKPLILLVLLLLLSNT